MVFKLTNIHIVCSFAHKPVTLEKLVCNYEINKSESYTAIKLPNFMRNYFCCFQ